MRTTARWLANFDFDGTLQAFLGRFSEAELDFLLLCVDSHQLDLRSNLMYATVCRVAVEHGHPGVLDTKVKDLTTWLNALSACLVIERDRRLGRIEVLAWPQALSDPFQGMTLRVTELGRARYEELKLQQATEPPPRRGRKENEQ